MFSLQSLFLLESFLSILYARSSFSHIQNSNSYTKQKIFPIILIFPPYIQIVRTFLIGTHWAIWLNKACVIVIIHIFLLKKYCMDKLNTIVHIDAFIPHDEKSHQFLLSIESVFCLAYAVNTRT